MVILATSGDVPTQADHHLVRFERVSIHVILTRSCKDHVDSAVWSFQSLGSFVTV